jgi:hypothetical protein
LINDYNGYQGNKAYDYDGYRDNKAYDYDGYVRLKKCIKMAVCYRNIIWSNKEKIILLAI